MFVHRQIEAFSVPPRVGSTKPLTLSSRSSVHFLFCLPLIMVMWLLDPVSSSPLEHLCQLFLLLGPNPDVCLKCFPSLVLQKFEQESVKDAAFSQLE